MPFRNARVGPTLIHLLLDVWVAVLCIVIWSVGLALTLGFAVTVVGGPFFLAITLAAALGIGRLERGRVGALLGREVRAPATEPAVHYRWGFIGRLIGSRAAWKALAYVFVQPIVGCVLFAVTAAVWAAGIVVGTVPLYVRLLPNNTAHLGFTTVHTAAQVAGACAVGVAILACAPIVTLAAGRVDLGLVRALLGPNPEAELHAQVADASARRNAAVEAADAERRRIERDLHDGAQQRLVALGMTLGLAREKLATDPQAAQLLIDEAHAEAKSAMTELRAIARGIHPAVLDDRGLDAALSALAARCPIPVRITARLPGRYGPAVEGAAYYVVSESLTNIAKHANATTATVTVEAVQISQRAMLRVQVIDDGDGGAVIQRDGGLEGLRDRVTGVGGSFAVESPIGGPTVLIAELPT